MRCRTVLIVDRAALDRTVEGVMDRWSSAMAWGWEGEGVGARTPHIYRYLIIYFLPPLPGVPTKAASPPPASTGHLPGLGGRGSERFGDQVRETEHSRGHIRPESAAVENVKPPAITCEISVLHSKSIPPSTLINSCSFFHSYLYLLPEEFQSQLGLPISGSISLPCMALIDQQNLLFSRHASQRSAVACESITFCKPDP